MVADGQLRQKWFKKNTEQTKTELLFEGQSKRTDRVIDTGVIILLIALLVFNIARARFGLDTNDEAYYNALTYRLCLGDQLFSEIWSPHQLVGVLLLPFMSIYLFFTQGDTQGIVLYMRIVYFSIQFATSLYAYFF